eukprot:6427166-Prymnesium_polylepis.1
MRGGENGQRSETPSRQLITIYQGRSCCALAIPTNKAPLALRANNTWSQHVYAITYLPYH